jgi:hypothetical protein
VKKTLIIIAAVLGGLFILGSCGVFAVAVATAPPATKAATSSSTPAPSPSVTTPTPAPTPKATPKAKPSKPAEPKAPSRDEQYAEFLSGFFGVTIDTDTPEFRDAKRGVLDICQIAEDARKDGMPATLFAAALTEASGGDETVLTLAVGGMYVYCPTEFAWLDAGVNGTSQAA